MTKTRTLAIAALSAIFIFGVGGQAAFAKDPQFHATVIGRIPESATSEANGQTLFQLSTGVGTAAPLDGTGNDQWPCLTGDPINWPDCSSLPSGGLVIGVPAYTVPLANCLNPNVSCVSGYEVVEDDNPSTTEYFGFRLEVRQGNSKILDTGNLIFFPNVPNVLQLVGGNIYFGPGNCAVGTCVSPVAGKATATTRTFVGAAVVVGQATFYFR